MPTIQSEPIDDHVVFTSDGGKGLQRLDDAFDEYPTIPVTVRGARRYSRRELDSLDNPSLRGLATERGLSGDFGDQHANLVRLLLNTQRVPVAFGGASIPAVEEHDTTCRSASHAEHRAAGEEQ